jgi:hypothetical protein
MSSVNPTASEDVIRLFFRTQVNNLDKLLDLVFSTFRAATNGQPDISDWAIEVNTIFLVSYLKYLYRAVADSKARTKRVCQTARR